jgi:putative DNA primase/helicase
MTTARIEERQAETDVFYAEIFGQTTIEKPKLDSFQTFLDDEAVLKKARNSKNGDKFQRLYSGDWSGYPSHSEGDLSFCNQLVFWCGNNPAQIDSIFKTSGLFRPKWNEKHSGNGQTYGEMTIQKAINNVLESYKRPNKSQKKPKPSQKDYKCTDAGNGERFADQHRDIVRYSYPERAWYVWDKTRWKRDNEGLVRQLAKKTCRTIYAAAEKENDGDKRSRLGKWAASSESSFKQKAMLEMAQSEPEIPILPEKLDRNKFLLNVKNGTINLETGKLISRRKTDFITKLIPIDYNPDALCNKWLEFLKLIMNGKRELIDYLCRVAGYALTGDNGEQCLFLLWGAGQNGKSTFLNVLQSVLSDYSLQTGFSTFTTKRNEGIRNDIARMRNARLVVAVENGDGKRLDEPLVKQLTGGDRITVRFLHQEYFEYIPEFKIFLATNYKPTIYGQDLAIWRRIRLIPFTVKIPDSQRINNYENVLLKEKEGILNWMISGCQEWQKNGLQEPDVVKMATNKYRSEMDILEDFIQSRCVLETEKKTTHKELYAAYARWCEENGEFAVTTNTFGKKLIGRGFEFTKPQNVKTWKDIELV